jgi:hypothetical protein
MDGFHATPAWTDSFVYLAWELRASIFSVGVTFIVFVFQRLFSSKPRAGWAIEHSHKYTLTIKKTDGGVHFVAVDTQAIFVQNTPDIPYVLRVSHSEGEGKCFQWPQQVMQGKVVAASVLLMYLGLFAAVYLVVRLIRFLT